MDAEGLGRELLLTPSGDPRRPPEKQTVGTVTASHKMLTLQTLSSSLNADTAKRGCLAEEMLLSALRQSVPENGCVHVHIIDLGAKLSISDPTHSSPNEESVGQCRASRLLSQNVVTFRKRAEHFSREQRERELTKFCGKLSQFCAKLGEFALGHK